MKTPIDEKQAKKLIRNYKRWAYSDDVPDLRQSTLTDYFGERICYRDGNIEIATTYFYKNQNHTAHLVQKFHEWLQEQGFKLYPDPDDTVLYKGIMLKYDTKPWPKYSWATAYCIILEV
jgi:hypothetical protein